MPIYEYECGACGHIFEEIVFGSEEAITCPECQSSTIKKLMSSPAAVNSNNDLSSSLSGVSSSAGGSCGSGGFS